MPGSERSDLYSSTGAAGGRWQPELEYGDLGVTPEYQTVRDWPLAAGRFLTKQDDESGATVAVLGQTVVEIFGPGQNPGPGDSHS